MQNVYKEAMKSVIDKQAEKLYQYLGLKPGFDILEVVGKLGGVINSVERDSMQESVDARISPADGNRNFQIAYIGDIDDGYVRFSIAHELGHLFLHMSHSDENGNFTISGDYNRQEKNCSIIEWEAEEFAAAFLMPETVFRMKIECTNENLDIDDKIQYLAEQFKVPYKSIITRGKSLDIW